MDAMLALYERFGMGLTLEKRGNGARWSYDGQAAVVELRPDGMVTASFEDRPTLDLASSRKCVARYRSLGSGYALTPTGYEHLARDIGNFFSGGREPRFAFISLQG